MTEISETDLIITDATYQDILARVSDLMDAAPGSPEEAELDRLATAVEAFEEDRWPMDEPDPIEAIRFRMEQGGYSFERAAADYRAMTADADADNREALRRELRSLAVRLRNHMTAAEQERAAADVERLAREAG